MITEPDGISTTDETTSATTASFTSSDITTSLVTTKTTITSTTPGPTTATSSLTSPSSTVTVSDGHQTTLHTGTTMDRGTGAGVAIAVIILILGGAIIFYFLRKRGRLLCLEKVRGRPRRSSTSSSRHPLEPDDTESVDNMPHLTDGDMFAIAEPEEPDAGADDGYYYDEVFGSSAFEDETTKASNKDLFTSVSDDQDIPDLLLRVDNLR